MRRRVTQKLTVELTFPASEKHDADGGQEQAISALRDEAKRLGLDFDDDHVLASGPTLISWEHWDGQNPKERYDDQVFTAWGWATS